MDHDLVFISHSSADKFIADAICHSLEERKIRCWIAPRDISSTDWASSIMDGLHQSDIFVVVVSRDSIYSPEVTKEITEASRTCRYILPFKIDDEVLNDRMRYHLGPCHWLDAICPPLEEHIGELIHRIEHLSDEDAIYMNRECISLSERILYPRESFLGRDSEIEAVRERLSDNHILFLEGMGGIGKSEIAKAYAKEHRDQYDTIIFASYVTDLIDMVCGDELPIANLHRADEETQESWFRRKLNAFHTLASPKTLLIIDNYDTDEDAHLQELISSPCHFLITTRNEHPDYPSMHIEPIRNFDDVRKMFASHYGRPLSAGDMGFVDEILKLINCHTITVELIAKQMKASFLKPSQMLERLKSTGVNLQLKEKVKREGDGQKLSAFDYICELFSLSRLSEDECGILRYMCLIPHSGVPVPLFGEMLEFDDYDAINDLIGKSWLRLDDEEGSISLHPVIGDVVRAKLGPTQQNCKDYIHGLYLKIRDCWYFTEEERNELYPYLSWLLRCFPEPTVELFNEYCSFAYIPWICGDFRQAQKTARDLYEFAKRQFGETSMEASRAALANAAAYYNAGDRMSAEPWYKASLEIQLANGGAPTADLAQTYMRVGRSAFYNRNDYAETQKYYDRSMDVFEELIRNNDIKEGKKYPEQYEDLFAEIERLRMAEGKYEEALELCRRSYEISCANNGVDNSSCVYSLVDMGICYSMLGRYDEAEKHLLHALEINLKNNGKSSMQTARTREALANNEVRRGDYSHAREIMSDLFMDLEKYFGPDSPLTVQVRDELNDISERC